MTDRMERNEFEVCVYLCHRGVADRETQVEIAKEAERALREEAQLQDRIHALEVQQAELLRQAKEKDAALHECNQAISALVQIQDTQKLGLAKKDATLRAIGERLVAAGGTRDGTVLETLNAVLDRRAEQIKALADALVRGAPRSIGLEDVPCWCSLADDHDNAPSQTCALNTAALAKAGRKP